MNKMGFFFFYTYVFSIQSDADEAEREEREVVFRGRWRGLIVVAAHGQIAAVLAAILAASGQTGYLDGPAASAPIGPRRFANVPTGREKRVLPTERGAAPATTTAAPVRRAGRH